MLLICVALGWSSTIGDLSYDSLDQYMIGIKSN